MTNFERIYATKEEQERMLQEVEKALIEKGYECEYRNNLFFVEDDEVDWVLQKSILVNPTVLKPNEENGMLYMIQIFDKNGYHFIANLIMQNDEGVEENFRYRGFTPPTVESVIDFIENYDKRFPGLEEEKLVQYGCIC